MNKVYILGAISAASMTAVASTASIAAIINFDDQGLSGPKTFNLAGNARTLSIDTDAGEVTISGGVILQDVTFLPANSSAVYGTANNVTNIDNNSTRKKSLTIKFKEPVTNFFLSVFNGLPVPNLNYTVADDMGNASTFALSGSNQGGFQKIGFPAAGKMVTITPDTSASALAPNFEPGAYDFLIDDITFNTELPGDLLDPVSEVVMPTPTEPTEPSAPDEPTTEPITPTPEFPEPVAVPEPTGILGLLTVGAFAKFAFGKKKPSK
ncbi:MAG: PEP-CTERM sorting domain-containing protein [Cyanobacteria bacterium J06627_28]